MDLGKILNYSFVSCGLVGVLMLFMAILAFLRNRRKISERTATFAIGLTLLIVLLALSVGEN